MKDGEGAATVGDGQQLGIGAGAVGGLFVVVLVDTTCEDGVKSAVDELLQNGV